MKVGHASGIRVYFTGVSKDSEATVLNTQFAHPTEVESNGSPPQIYGLVHIPEMVLSVVELSLPKKSDSP